MSIEMSAVDAVIAALGDSIDYSISDHSFSPHYSDIGLGFAASAAPMASDALDAESAPSVPDALVAPDASVSGIESLFLHYNRNTTTFGSPFLQFIGGDAVPSVRRTALSVEHEYADGGLIRTAFVTRNTFLVSCSGLDGLAFHFSTDGQLPGEARVSIIDGCHLYEGYLPKADEREPDEVFPIIIGMRIIRGEAAQGDGLTEPLRVAPDGVAPDGVAPDGVAASGGDDSDDGTITEIGSVMVAFTVDVLDIDRVKTVQLLNAVPESVDVAVDQTRDWLATALGTLDVSPLGLSEDPDAESQVLAHAAYSLAGNCCMPPGMLRGRVALYPARGSYPIIAPWDACFHALGLTYMESRLAEDQVLILTDNGIRADGKIACFIACTWRRPELSQPALAGWAVERIYDERFDQAFIRKTLPGLVLNNQWWLGHRMTQYGVISCPQGVESGWDNSPRWDRGPILATDMNTWLLMQLRTTVRFARLLGDDEIATRTQVEADSLASAMMDVLYDYDKNIFRDVVVATGEPVDVITPASVLPLLGGVGIEDESARRMIENVLLDSEQLFGEYPFPCVAYCESTYESHEYWRGPVWIPVAWMMLELLGKYGYLNERHEAAERLYRMVIRDAELREWFDSSDGHGCGAHDQGWTAAILLRLRMELGAGTI
jgi:hypothetical protein